MFSKEAIERFESNVYPDPNSGCFIWGGPEDRKGYGKFKSGGCHHIAHRVAWIIAGFDLPCKSVLRHRCDIRCCVNVDHLVLGSTADNALDMAARCRGRRGPLPYGTKMSGSRCKPYRARIKLGGRFWSFGNYRTVEEAADAALAGKRATLILLGRKASEIML